MAARKSSLSSTPVAKSVRFGDSVSTVLRNFKKGDKEYYNLLLQQLQEEDMKSDNLFCWLRELNECALQLSRDHELLVGAILTIEWVNREAVVVLEYQRFIEQLVSAQPIYLKACLKMLVKIFIPTVSTVQTERGFDIVHSTIESITHRIPMSPSILIPILTELFPYRTRDALTLKSYVQNLLTVSKYLPNYREKILEIVVEKVTNIDVNTTVDDLDEPDYAMAMDNVGIIDETIFDMDGLDDRPGNDMWTSNLKEGLPMSNEMADKLDILMGILFNFIRQSCFNTETGDLMLEQTKTLFREIIRIYDRIILPTHASNHIQYIVFYIASFHPILYGWFIDFTLKKLTDPNTVPILRQATAGYIASFVSRAKYCTVSNVAATLELLVKWVHVYMDSLDTCRNLYPDVTRHGPLYSVCQAVFYIFIFKHRELIDHKEYGLSFIRQLCFEKIIMSKLNPLKVCLPTVVSLFARLTRMYQIVLCYTVIDRNKRMCLPVITSHNESSRLTNINPLDSFFPFDPYRLPRSRKFIADIYQEWVGEQPENDVSHSVGTHKQSANEDDVDDFLDDDVESDDDEMKCNGSLTPNAPSVLTAYGTSPGFNPMYELQSPTQTVQTIISQDLSYKQKRKKIR